MGGAYRTSNATVSAYGAVAVVVSDSTIIPVTRGLFVGTGGNVAVRMADGMTLTFTGVLAGILPLQVDRVLSTGTTASNMIALY
jgi:hypothetical protein